MSTVEETLTVVLALERAALDRWGKGEPGGYLAISAHDVSYFDPIHPRRIDGLDALTKYYDPIRGQIQIIQDDIVEPRVQLYGDVAVLSFHYFSQGSEGRKKWNCTEVYARDPDGWRIVHTHWSFAAPDVESAGTDARSQP